MPNKSDGNSAVGDRWECEPNDNNDLELLEVYEFRNHAHGNGGAESSACRCILKSLHIFIPYRSLIYFSFPSRQAPPSPEVNEVNSDDEDYVQEPVTPAKGRKARVKYEITLIEVCYCLQCNRKTIKSEEFIEDSDVEEHETR